MLRTVLITLLSLLCLNSCKIDGEEEITLHENGSGSLRVSYTLPYRAFSEKDSQDLLDCGEALCEQHSSLKWLNGTHKPAGYGFQKIEFCIGFESIQELAKAIETEKTDRSDEGKTGDDSIAPSIVATMLGQVAFLPDWQGFSFQRDIDLSPLFKEKVSDPRVLGDAEFRYILHLPYHSGENNATVVSNDGKSLLWKIPLQQHLNTAFTIKAGVRVGWMIWCWIGIGLLAAGLIWLAWRWVSRKKSQACALNKKPS